MFRLFQQCLLVATLAFYTHGAAAEDARSIALGGSVIANGKGAHGAMANPASMMNMKRRGEGLHMRFGISGEIRDTGNTIDTLTDSANENLISDIDAEINALSQTNIQCNPVTGESTDPCVSGTQNLSDLSGRLLDILDLVDGETIDAQARADLGVAYTKSRYPIAVQLRVSATGSGEPEIAESDRDYIEEFETLLDDDEITLGEAEGSSFLQVDDLGLPLAITQPEDVLGSSTTGNALLRTQLAISVATTLKSGDREFDVGVTPKFSSLSAYRVESNVRDEFVDGSESLADRFEDSEVSESSFTFDLGSSVMLKKNKIPLQLAAVIKNVIPESIKTADGFAFETDPQLIVGAATAKGRFTFSGDVALNAAKVDNFETQKLALGVEMASRQFALRAGISHDASREKDATSLSLGFGLGPLDIGGRLNGAESLEAGVQLAFSF